MILDARRDLEVVVECNTRGDFMGDVAGIGTGSKTHQTTHSTVTPRVMAGAGSNPDCHMRIAANNARMGPPGSASALNWLGLGVGIGGGCQAWALQASAVR